MSRSDDLWVANTPVRARAEVDPAGVKSVSTALDVLECFATDGDLGVSDVARRLGIAKSSAHRILHTLRVRGFVEQDAQTGLYRLGLHIFELGQLSQARNSLRHAALPVLRHVAAQTGLTVNFGVPDAADVVFIERIEIGVGGQILSHAGRRLPGHTTSSGKVLAAFNPSVQQARIDAGFPPRVSRTVRTAEDWNAVLDHVRRTGFAVSRDESFDNTASLAVPVLKNKVAVASISVFGTSDLIDPRLEQLVPLLVAASNRVAAALPTSALPGMFPGAERA